MPSLSGPSTYLYLLQPEDLARETGLPLSKIRSQLREEDIVPRPSGRSGLDPSAVRRVLKATGRRYPFRIFAHANLKGGIGKTTSALAVATRAASLGYRTIILDMDPQASASLALGVETSQDDAIFYDIWSKPAEHLPGALYEIQPGLLLLPSSLENSLLDSSLQHPALQKNAVRDVCAVLRQQDADLVVLDCPPSLGAATISALSAAHRLIIPVGTDAFSFKGLALTLSELAAITETFNLPPPERTVLLSRYDQREALARQAWERLQREYPEVLAPRPIRTSSLFGKALESRHTLFAGYRQHPVREDYEIVIRTLLE